MTSARVRSIRLKKTIPPARSARTTATLISMGTHAVTSPEEQVLAPIVNHEGEHSVEIIQKGGAFAAPSNPGS